MIVKYPVDKNALSVEFGVDFSNDPEKKDFYTLFDGKHPGVDFKIPEGTEVFATIPGIIVRKEFHKGMGNVVATRNGNIYALYAHLSEFNVELGEIVDTGDLIGLSGNTGSATTYSHLHFEMRDLTKQSLREMVFAPPFGSKLDNYSETFEHKIKNENTPKTLNILSERYFGTKSYWKKIAEINSFVDVAVDDVLTDGVKIVVPNY